MKSVLQASGYDFATKRLHCGCFTVSFVKLLRTAILWNNCKQLLLHLKFMNFLTSTKHQNSTEVFIYREAAWNEF